MQPVNTYNNIHGIQPIANVNSRYSTTYSANDMPINHHTNFVDETSSLYRRYNNLAPNYMKNVYSQVSTADSGPQIRAPKPIKLDSSNNSDLSMGC